MIKNILFVCKYNRFRSKFAEAYFNKINKNKKIKAKSAGIIMGRPIDKFQISAAKKFGVRLRGSPKGLSTNLLKWQDMIIIVADDIPPSIFKDGRIMIWRIRDVGRKEVKEKIDNLIKLIVKKVEKLSKFLNKEAGIK